MKMGVIMNKIAIVFTIILSINSALFAHSKIPAHTGNHMHEGKMTNHLNKNGMTDEELKKYKEELKLKEPKKTQK